MDRLSALVSPDTPFRARMDGARALGRELKDDAGFVAEVRVLLFTPPEPAPIELPTTDGLEIFASGQQTSTAKHFALHQAAAAAAAATSGADGLMRELLAGPSTLLRPLAARAAARATSRSRAAADAELVDTWRASVPAAQSRLLRELRKARRLDALDAIHADLSQRGRDAEAAAMLHTCSAPVVAAALAADCSHPKLHWTRLCRFHSAAVLAAIEADMVVADAAGDNTVQSCWYMWASRLRAGSVRPQAASTLGRVPAWELARCAGAALFGLLTRFRVRVPELHRHDRAPLILSEDWASPLLLERYLAADADAVVAYWLASVVVYAPMNRAYVDPSLVRSAHKTPEATQRALWEAVAAALQPHQVYRSSCTPLDDLLKPFHASAAGIAFALRLRLAVLERLPPTAAEVRACFTSSADTRAVEKRDALVLDYVGDALKAVCAANRYATLPTAKAEAAAEVVREALPLLADIFGRSQEPLLAPQGHSSAGSRVLALAAQLPLGSAEAVRMLLGVADERIAAELAAVAAEDPAVRAGPATALGLLLSPFVNNVQVQRPPALVAAVGGLRRELVQRMVSQVVSAAPEHMWGFVQSLALAEPTTTPEDVAALLAVFPLEELQRPAASDRGLSLAQVLARAPTGVRVELVTRVLNARDGFNEQVKRTLAPLRDVTDLAARDELQQACDSNSPTERFDALCALWHATLVDGSCAAALATLQFVTHKTRNAAAEQREEWLMLLASTYQPLLDVMLFAPDASEQIDLLAELDAAVEATLSAQDCSEHLVAALQDLSANLASAAARVAVAVALQPALGGKWPAISAPYDGSGRVADADAHLLQNYTSVLARTAAERGQLPAAAGPLARAVVEWAGRTQMALARHSQGDEAADDFLLCLMWPPTIVGPFASGFTREQRLLEAQVVTELVEAGYAAAGARMADLRPLSGYFGSYALEVPRLREAAEEHLRVLRDEAPGADGQRVLPQQHAPPGAYAAMLPLSVPGIDADAAAELAEKIEEALTMLQSLFHGYRSACKGRLRAHAWREVPVLRGFVETLLESNLAMGVFPTWFAAEVTKLRGADSAAARRDAAVQRLLAISPSAVHLKPVWRHLVRERQDLLMPFLVDADSAFAGVFDPEYASQHGVTDLLGHARFARRGTVAAVPTAVRMAASRGRPTRGRGGGGGRGRGRGGMGYGAALRKSAKREPFLLPAVWDLHRLHPEHVRVLAERLLAIAGDGSKATVARVAAMRRYTMLPTTTFADIAVFLAENDPTVVPPVADFVDDDDEEEDWSDVGETSDEPETAEQQPPAGGAPVAVIEAALKGLMRNDEPCAPLGYMLSPKWVTGERSRVAAYAIARCLPHIHPEQLEPLVDALLVDAVRPRLKVTTFKQLLRLAGRLRPEKSLEILEREWFRPKQHRDVRVTMLQTAWELLVADADESQVGIAWRILESAVPLANLVERAGAKRARQARVRAGKQGNSVGTKRKAEGAEAEAAANKPKANLRLRVAPKNAQELVMSLLAGTASPGARPTCTVEGDLKVVQQLAATLAELRHFCVPPRHRARYVHSVLGPLLTARNPDVRFVALGCVAGWLRSTQTERSTPDPMALRAELVAALSRVVQQAATGGAAYWLPDQPDERARNYSAARNAINMLAPCAFYQDPTTGAWSSGLADEQTVVVAAGAAVAEAARGALAGAVGGDHDARELRSTLLALAETALRATPVVVGDRVADPAFERRFVEPFCALGEPLAPTLLDRRLEAVRAALQAELKARCEPSDAWLAEAKGLVQLMFDTWAEDPAEGAEAVNMARCLIDDVHSIEVRTLSLAGANPEGPYVQLVHCFLRVCLAPPDGVPPREALATALRLLSKTAGKSAAAMVAGAAQDVLVAAGQHRDLVDDVASFMRAALREHLRRARLLDSAWRGVIQAALTHLVPLAVGGDWMARDVVAAVVARDAGLLTAALEPNVLRDLLMAFVRHDAADEALATSASVPCARACAELVAALCELPAAMVGCEVVTRSGVYTITGVDPRRQLVSVRKAGERNDEEWPNSTAAMHLRKGKVTPPLANALWQALLVGRLAEVELTGLLRGGGRGNVAQLTLELEGLSLSAASGGEAEAEAEADMQRRCAWAALERLPHLLVGSGPLRPAAYDLATDSPFATFLGAALARGSALRRAVHEQLPHLFNSALRTRNEDFVESVYCSLAAEVVQWLAAGEFLPEGARTPDAMGQLGRAAVELLQKLGNDTMTRASTAAGASTERQWDANLTAVVAQLEQHQTPSVRRAALKMNTKTVKTGCRRFS